MELKEERIRKITNLYYSKPEILNAIFEFSKNREISPRYFEGFGKRPDSFQYPGDIVELAKSGATSFHCSEEIWQNPLDLSTSMKPAEMNHLRIGWDLLVDIDCKYFDFSKKAAEAVIMVLKNHGIKNIGLKFSGGKGFHIIVPWKAFPKTLAGEETKNLFPELPRKIISYVRFKAERELKEMLSEEDFANFRNSKIKSGIKCENCKELAQELKLTDYSCEKCPRKETRKIVGETKSSRCPDCSGVLEITNEKKIYECRKCGISSEKNPENFPSHKVVYEKSSEKNPGNFSRSVEVDLFELMGLDLILVSPRHLFRMPYSLHEKTSLASVVIDVDSLKDFQPKDADPLKVKIKNFLPDAGENEAKELVSSALDFAGSAKEEIHSYFSNSGKQREDFKKIKIENLSDSYLPPSIRKILLGMSDGKKRALFILINLFLSIGMEKAELEKRISEWNKKNNPPLKEGYIKSQLIWSYRNKVVPPPNFDKDYYRGIGIIPEEEELRMKNPVAYILKKTVKNNEKRARKHNFKN